MRNVLLLVALGCMLSGNSVWAAVPIVDLNDGSNNSNDSGAIMSDAGPVAAAPDPLAARQSMPTDQRLRLLEQQVGNLVQMDLSGRIDKLEQEIQQLNGQLEVQAHTIQTLTDQQKSLAQDVDERLNGAAKPPAAEEAATAATTTPSKALPKPVKPVAKTAKAATTAASKTPAATTDAVEQTPAAAVPTDESPDATVAPNAIASAESSVVQNTPRAQDANAATAVEQAGSEEKAYQSAFNLLVTKQNSAAIAAFQAFLKSYPHGAYTANAHYWLGESYNTAGKAAAASKEFTTLIQQYPTDAKVPDAMLKLAIIHDSAGQHAKARQEMQKVVQQFPDTTAARLAKMRLQTTGGAASAPSESSDAAPAAAN